MNTNLLNRVAQIRNAVAPKRFKRNCRQYQIIASEYQIIEIRKAQRAAALKATVEKLNALVDDTTFLFVVRDYGNFYSVQLFEGIEESQTDRVMICDNSTLKYEIPMRRRSMKSLESLEGYITSYYQMYIAAQKELALSDSPEVLLYKTQYIDGLSEDNKLSEYRQSRAVYFTAEMFVYWQKHHLLPVIKTLANGKRYNRSAHWQKVVKALENNNFFFDEKLNCYVVYWEGDYANRYK